MSKFSKLFGAAGGTVRRNVWDAAKIPAEVLSYDSPFINVSAWGRVMDTASVRAFSAIGYVGGLYLVASYSQYQTASSLLVSAVTRSYPTTQFLGGALTQTMSANHPSGAHLVLVGWDTNGFFRIGRTVDGINWTTPSGVTVGDGRAPMMLRYDAVAGEYLLGLSDGKFYRSTDGSSFTLVSAAPSVFFFDMANTGTHRVFVTSGGIYRTADMATFTSVKTLGGGLYFQHLALCGSRLVALMGRDPAYSSVAPSTAAFWYSDDDGATWTQGYSWRCIAAQTDGTAPSVSYTYLVGNNATLASLINAFNSAHSTTVGDLMVTKVTRLEGAVYEGGVYTNQVHGIVTTRDGVNVAFYDIGSYTAAPGSVTSFYTGGIAYANGTLLQTDTHGGTTYANPTAKEIVIEH